MTKEPINDERQNSAPFKALDRQTESKSANGLPRVRKTPAQRTCSLCRWLPDCARNNGAHPEDPICAGFVSASTTPQSPETEGGEG